jgi:hypothetical protein
MFDVGVCERNGATGIRENVVVTKNAATPIRTARGANADSGV